MSEMVERVARAIYELEHGEYAAGAVAAGAAQVTFVFNPHRYARKARAAIAAMREPTAAQVAAFHATLEWMSDTPLAQQQRDAHADETRRRWRLMIDAALADETMTAPTHPKTATAG